MADILQSIGMGPADGAQFQRVTAVVRPGSHFSIMPSPLLQMLGIDPQWTDMLREPGGSEEEHSMAEVKIRIDDRERTTICVFGPADSQPVLGKYTLDGFGLTVDEAKGKLVPADIHLK